jgi:hypothetical protein
VCSALDLCCTIAHTVILHIQLVSEIFKSSFGMKILTDLACSDRILRLRASLVVFVNCHILLDYTFFICDHKPYPVVL